MSASLQNQPPPCLDQINLALMENACVSITDKYGNIIYVSQAFCRQCGYSEQELIGKNHSMLRSQVHSESFYAFMWSTISSGTTWKGEICNINKRGEQYWVERTITPLLDDNQHAEYYLAISNDITQQKSLIRKLKTRAQQQGLIAILGQLSINSLDIQMFMEQSLAAVCGALDMKRGMIFDISDDAGYALLRASTNLQGPRETQQPIALKGDDILSYTLKQSAPLTSRDVNSDSRFTSSDIFSCEGMESAIAVRIGDRKQPSSIMVLLCSSRTDITTDDTHFAQSASNLISEAVARHRMESRLIREKELSRKYLDVADIIIIALDQHGNISLANQKASSTLCLEQEDLLGMNWFDYFVPYQERERARSDFGKFLRGEPAESTPYDSEYFSSIVTGQAKIRLIKWNNTIIRDEQNSNPSLLCAGEDITDVTEARQARDKMREKLFEAQKREALGILAGGITHDFNNILSSILGYTELSLERFAGSNPKLVEYLQHIKQSGVRARDIIQQIQNYNQPIQPGMQSVMLSSLLKDSLKMMRSAIPTSVSFKQQLDSNVPAVRLDPSRLNQLVMNLIINARNVLVDNGNIHISLADAGNVQQRCLSCGEDFSGHFVELTVTDSGESLDLEELESLFAGEAELTDSGHGFADRLLSIDEIVHASGGHIQAHRHGDTNVFRILLEVATTETRLQQDRPSLNSDATIMIVDDENSVAGFLGELFHQYGFNSRVYSDPTQALEAFSRNPQDIDLVITDQTMPLISGDQLASRMLELRADLPVILCSGRGDLLDETQARSLGIKSFLKKPVQTRELLDCVNQLLGRQQSS